jgi:hypothetical protein
MSEEKENMITKPGVYKISNAEYHSKDVSDVPCLSRSVIYDLLYNSPKRAWYNHPALNPEFVPDNDKKFDLGTAGHALLFEADVNCVIIYADDYRKKSAQEERDAAISEGKNPLLEKQFDQAQAMCEAAISQIKECPELGITDLQTQGDAELSYFSDVKAPISGNRVRLKVRPDWISADRKLIIDGKFTGLSANPESIGKQISNMNYEIQDGLYRKVVGAVEGTSPKFVFIFIEVEPPHLCSFISLPPEFMAMGNSEVDMGIFKWDECLSKNKWQGYTKRICYPELSQWAEMRWNSIAERIGV